MDKPIKWVLVPQMPTPDMVRAMAVAWQASDDGNECLAEYLAALAAAPQPPHLSMTREEAQRFQNWRGMDGASAFHLIERHANGWEDVARMMDAWLQANRETHNAKLNGTQQHEQT